jgi:hypothetical protein
MKNSFLWDIDFEVLTVVVMKNSILWDIDHLLYASFLLGLFFNREDGGDVFL